MRKVDAIPRTTALIVAAFILYWPANIYPMSQSMQVGQVVQYRIIDGIRELFKAGLVDGLTPLQIFRTIYLPLASGGLATCGILNFIFSWNEFLFALTMSSKNALTIPVHMAGAVDTRGVQFWFMSTRAIIAMVPPVVLALLAQRYIVRGLTLGAVKG